MNAESAINAIAAEIERRELFSVAAWSVVALVLACAAFLARVAFATMP